MPKYDACSGVVTSIRITLSLGSSLFLSMLKKLYPRFFSPSSLNCELCQYAKLHRVHLSPRVNKRNFAPFELVHYIVWGRCPIMSLTGFKYFVTFVDDFSRFTWFYLMKVALSFFLNLASFVLKFKHNFMLLFKH